MKKIRLISAIYLGLSALAILCVVLTTAKAVDVLPGIIYIWICYLCMYMAYKGRTAGHLKLRMKENKCIFNKKWILAVVAAYSIVFIVGKFYTGISPVQAIKNLFSGISNYNLYQAYFKKEQLYVLSFKKVPILLLNGISEFIILYCILYIGVIKGKRNLQSYLLIIALLGAKLYLGIVRGTNYETFQVLFIVVYLLWVGNQESRIPIRNIIFTMIGAVMGAVVFVNTIMKRGISSEFIRIAGSVVLDEKNIIVQQWREFALFITKICGYLSIGIVYLSHYLVVFCFDSLGCLLRSFVPLLNVAIHGNNTYFDEEPYLNSISWTPDIVPTINLLGLFGGLMVFFFFGRIYKYIDEKMQKNEDVFAEMLLFYLTFELFSMPVSSFIGVSSASKISIIMVIFFLAIEKYKIKII